MENDVDAFLRRLAQELRPRANESAGVMLRRMRRDLPELWGYEDLAAFAPAETAGHVAAFLDVLGHGLGATEIETPPGALEVARRFARSGVPVSKLLRAYRLGHMTLLQQIQAEATRLSVDWELINAAGTRLVAMAFEYVDRVSEQVVAAYQEERDRRLQRRLILTNEASRLIGTTLDIARTAQELTEVCTDEFADLVAIGLLDSVLTDEGTCTPVMTPVLLRIAQRSVLDGCPDSAVATGQTHSYPARSEPAHALATGQSLLHLVTASGVPAWMAPSSDHEDALCALGLHSILLLPLQARGNTLGLAQFVRHRTAACFDDDLLLAQEIAACLYAIYDPVSRLCSLASAGHVLPAVVTPLPANGDAPASKSVYFPDLPIGPPLGLGGLPFETAQLELPEGSLLAMFTDGLIESRTRDVDTALALLRDVLAQAPDSPDEVCDRLLAALLPSRPADDVALLVARPRALDPGHVATLDLPSDPATVSGARTFASCTLTAWGLEELSFSTELIISELVTNAIRHGKSPVQMRLILQDTLTCEVFDSSSTAPHLRRARNSDEGGRGLLLVAQLAERWGTRHSREGKVIWAEQVLPAARRAGSRL